MTEQMIEQVYFFLSSALNDQFHHRQYCSVGPICACNFLASLNFHLNLPYTWLLISISTGYLQEAFLPYTTKTCGASFQLISLPSPSTRPDSYYFQFWLNLTIFTYIRVLKLQVFNFSLCLISVWQIL